MTTLAPELTDFINSPDVPPPDHSPSIDDAPKFGVDECEVCGKGLVYGGRGRHPKRCDEHKKNASVRSTSGIPKQTASIEKISVHFAMLIDGAGRLVGAVESFDGLVLRANAEGVGKAVGNIAERDPAFRRKMEAMLARTSYAELVVLGMAMLTPIAIHHGAIRMDEESRHNYEDAYRQANADILA